jgi:hypothetical protein
MLRLSEPTLTFRGQDCKQFLEKHDNGLDILAEFLEDPTTVPEDITKLQVSSFRNPFQEIAWLFTRITGQESTTSISRIVIYILYFTVKEQFIFDWGKLISIEICSQLSRFKESNKFYMSSYLIFAIVHCCLFPKLSLSKKINCEFDPVTFWYQALWRHKASHCFYEVFNDFVSVFKDLLLGKDAPRMSGQATKFLNRKGTLEQKENHSVLMVFGSKENPSFLPCHITDKMFVTEIARQYNHWLHFFHDKKKKQFIPLPWKVGDFVCRNVNKIDEFAGHFKNLNLTYAERIKGFDPNGIFREHLLAVGFSISFIHRRLTEDRDSDDNTPASGDCDVETLQSMTELYRQQGKVSGEKSVQSPTNTPKSTTSQSIASTTHPSKKETQKSSNGGGDKNPPRTKIDSSHKVPLTKKRKNIVGQADEPKIESEQMQLEIEIEHMHKVGPSADAMHHSSAMEIAETDIFYEDESFVFQSVVFDSQSKNIVIEKRDVTNKKGKSRTEINFRKMRSSQISLFHRVTGDALDDSIGGIEAENARLNDRVKELEEAFIATPEFSSPLAKTVPATPATKLKGSSSLLASCRALVENNIKKRMQLVTEAWETSQNIASFRKRENDLHEHLQTNLKNDQHFYEQMLTPFSNHAINNSDLKRRQEDLPSPKRIKQLKACWKKKVKNLQLIVESCEQAISEKEELFRNLTQIDLAGSTNEVQDPNLILKSLSMTKEAFDEQLDILKGLSLEKFYDILEYRVDELENWLLDYATHNEEIEQALHSISMDLRKLENELFDIEIQDEINVAPMRSYIEEWFQRRMDNLIEEGKQPVGTIPATVDDNNKNTSAS